MRNTEKKYFKIKDVSEMLNIPMSTLRYWEQQFTIINPRRSRGNSRMYTSSDIEKIKMIWYLVKERGMKLAAAEREISQNRKNVSQKHEVIERLTSVKRELTNLEDVLEKLSRDFK